MHFWRYTTGVGVATPVGSPDCPDGRLVMTDRRQWPGCVRSPPAGALGGYADDLGVAAGPEADVAAARLPGRAGDRHLCAGFERAALEPAARVAVCDDIKPDPVARELAVA